MSKVVQLLERLSCPKSVTLQRYDAQGGICLSRHELYAAMCVSTSDLSVAVVLATEVGDVEALGKLQSYLEQELGDTDKARAMALIVGSELCGLPLGKTKQKIQSLLKRYGARANRSRRLIHSWDKAIKSLEKTGRHAELISKHRENIQREKDALNAFAERYSGQSSHCPRCGGTGEIQSEACSSCTGLGRFRNSPRDWAYQLKLVGVDCFPSDIERMGSLVSGLNAMKSETISLMGARAKAEQLD